MSGILLKRSRVHTCLVLIAHDDMIPVLPLRNLSTYAETNMQGSVADAGFAAW